MGEPIQNNNTEKCYPVSVSGMGNINSLSFGLEKICFNILHPSSREFEIGLSPNGTTISLYKRSGFLAGNFTNICFSTNAVKPISGGASPFVCTYIAENSFGCVT